MVWKAKTELKYLLVRGLPSMVEHFLAVAFPRRRLVASSVDKGGAVTCLVEPNGALEPVLSGQAVSVAASAIHPALMCDPGRMWSDIMDDDDGVHGDDPLAALQVRWVQGSSLGGELRS